MTCKAKTVKTRFFSHSQLKYKLCDLINKGVRKGGVRLTLPLSLIFWKNFITRRVYRAWFLQKNFLQKFLQNIFLQNKKIIKIEEYAYCVNKLCLKTWIWRQIVTSETAHTKHKWPPYATEWNPPWKVSAYATAYQFIIIASHTLSTHTSK